MLPPPLPLLEATGADDGLVIGGDGCMDGGEGRPPAPTTGAATTTTLVTQGILALKSAGASVERAAAMALAATTLAAVIE